MTDRTDIKSLKERIDLVKVVSHYQSLEKKGNSYVGLCPFHPDRHPSLRVDPQKGLYHCFSCGAGGDALGFVQKKEECGFGEAVRICAGICHLSVNAPVTQPKHQAQEQKPVPSGEENERYQRMLLPYDPGMEELRDTYALFGVGIAPPETPDTYAFTRRRLVFPIQDAGGKLVAFAARYLGSSPSARIPKYLNSPTSPCYKKDELLYGWYQALTRIRETGVLFITEGYKDTLAMHAAGFTNTVALCGTNLSVYHIEQIRKESATVCLFLDADKAGRETVRAVVPRLRKARLLVTVLEPEGGKDPDEMFRRCGRALFIRLVNRGMMPSSCRRAETLLVAACRCWPDTLCLTEDGKEMRYAENIREVLEYDDLLPEESLVCGSGPESEIAPQDREELDKEYALHTDLSHSVPVRRSELIRSLFLRYMEARLSDRIRRDSYCLSAAFADEEQYERLLAALQYQRNYLCEVSRALGRR